MEEVIPLSSNFIGYILATLSIGVVLLFVELIKGRQFTFKGTTSHQGSWYDFGLFIWFIILAILLSQRIASIVKSSLDLPEGSPWADVILGLSSQLGMLIFVCAITYYLPKLIGRPINQPESSRIKSGLWGLFSYFTALPLVMITGLFWGGFIMILKHLGYGVELKRQILVDLFAKSPSPSFTFTIFLFAVLIAPITEEIVFRGGIYRFLKSKGHPKIALVISALVFSIAHFNLTSFLPLFLLGMLLARAFERTGNIVTPITFHAIFNLNTLLLILIGPDLSLIDKLDQ